MNEQFLIYLWSVSENVRILLGNIGYLLLTLTGLSYFMMMPVSGCLDWDTIKINWLSINKKLLIVGIITTVLCSFIPSKQDLALIFTYPYIKKGVVNVAQSKQMQKLSEVSNLHLDKVIKDLKNGK